MTHRPADERLQPFFLTKSDADAKATRAFWRGVFCGVVATGILGGLAGWLS
jgi:hypothetical protein